MKENLTSVIYSQFGAALQMLGNTMNACPLKVWNQDEDFWYMSYHTLFFTDYYLSENPRNFHPPVPFTLSEMDPSGKMPERKYSLDELNNYLDHIWQRLEVFMSDFESSYLRSRFQDDYKDYSRLEIAIYNLRHIQHHVAQLNKLLRKHDIEPPKWVSQKQ